MLLFYKILVCVKHCLIHRHNNSFVNNRNACYVFNHWGHNAIPVVSLVVWFFCVSHLCFMSLGKTEHFVSELVQHELHYIFPQQTSKAVGNIWCNSYGEMSLLCMCRRKFNVYCSWKKMQLKVIIRNAFVFFSQEAAWLCLMAQLGRSHGSICLLLLF